MSLPPLSIPMTGGVHTHLQPPTSHASPIAEQIKLELPVISPPPSISNATITHALTPIFMNHLNASPLQSSLSFRFFVVTLPSITLLPLTAPQAP